MRTLELKFDELTTFELNNVKGGFKAGSDLSDSVNISGNDSNAPSDISTDGEEDGSGAE